MTLPLQLERNDRVGIVGITGTGKTEFLKQHVLAHCLANRKRVVAFDFKNELSIQGRPRRNTMVGPLPFKWTSRQFFQQPKVLLEPELRLSIVPDDPLDKYLCALTVKRIAEQLHDQHMDGHDLETVFVLEEVGFYADYKHFKNGRKVWTCEEWLTNLAQVWRDYGVCCVFVSPRAVGIKIGARSQCNQLVCFAQSEPADIEAIDERTGLHNPTFASKVATLAPPPAHNYEVWRLGMVEAVQPQQQPEAANEGNQGSDAGPAQQGEPHQDGGDGGRGAVCVEQNQQRNRHDELDVQARPVRGDEAQEQVTPTPAPAAALSDKTSSPPAPKASRKKTPPKPKPSHEPPPPQTQAQRTKSRRRTRAA